MVAQRKWLFHSRDLKPGDVVVVADSNSLRADYYLAVVKAVFTGEYGRVLKVTIAYKNFRIGENEKVHEYKGAKECVITRSVHTLALLVPIDKS